MERKEFYEKEMNYLVRHGDDFLPMVSTFSDFHKRLGELKIGNANNFVIYNVARGIFEGLENGTIGRDINNDEYKNRPMVGYAENQQGHPWWIVGSKNGMIEYSILPRNEREFRDEGILKVKKRNRIDLRKHFSNKFSRYFGKPLTIYTFGCPETFILNSLPAFGRVYKAHEVYQFGMQKPGMEQVEMTKRELIDMIKEEKARKRDPVEQEKRKKLMMEGTRRKIARQETQQTIAQ